MPEWMKDLELKKLKHGHMKLKTTVSTYGQIAEYLWLSAKSFRYVCSQQKFEPKFTLI